MVVEAVAASGAAGVIAESAVCPYAMEATGSRVMERTSESVRLRMVVPFTMGWSPERLSTLKVLLEGCLEIMPMPFRSDLKIRRLTGKVLHAV
jgi:UDP-N-acetyl-D-mannosaminuronate dehydrogenase